MLRMMGVPRPPRRSRRLVGWCVLESCADDVLHSDGILSRLKKQGTQKSCIGQRTILPRATRVLTLVLIRKRFSHSRRDRLNVFYATSSAVSGHCQEESRNLRGPDWERDLESRQETLYFWPESADQSSCVPVSLGQALLACAQLAMYRLCQIGSQQFMSNLTKSAAFGSMMNVRQRTRMDLRGIPACTRI